MINTKSAKGIIAFIALLFSTTFIFSCKKDDMNIPSNTNTSSSIIPTNTGGPNNNTPVGTTIGTTTSTKTGTTGTTGTTGATGTVGTTTGTTGTTTGTTVSSSLSYTTHAPIYLSGASNQKISGYNITGGSDPAITLSNCHDIHITKNLLQNSTASTGIIYLNNCYNIYIDTNLIKNGIRGVFVINCTNNIRIIYNRIYNTSDPNLMTNGGGSAIQLNKCNGTGIRIDSNMVWEPNPNQYIGDKISIYQSSGTASSYIRIWYNQVRGGSTNPAGFAGIALGDSGYSAYQDAEYNTVCSTGNVGMVIGGGQHMIMSNNKIYGAYAPVSAAGLMFFNNSSQASSDINIANNKINWTTSIHTICNYWFDPRTGITPVGATSNTSPGIGDVTVQDSILPNLLFNIDL